MTENEFNVLANEYERQTCFHSFARPMRQTPAYKSLVTSGDDVIPWIIKAFAKYVQNPDTGLWGMNWVLLLMDITNTTPIQPVVEDGFEKWSVDKTCKAWIKLYAECLDR